MSQGGTPLYVIRGAQPRPRPGQPSRRSSLRDSFILLTVMFGWMLFVFVLAAIAAPNDPNVEAPIEVGRGVIVNPADGWYSAADVWEVGPDAVSLQRAGAFVAFAAEEYQGGSDELLSRELEILEQEFDSYRVLPAISSTIDDGVPALTVFFSGTSDSRRLEGELVTASHDGTGVIMLALAPAGQLARVQGDLDTMLEKMVVSR